MSEETYQRLSDHVLKALKIAVEQKDVALSKHLNEALELSMTRGSGGEGFTERREFSDDVASVLKDFDALVN